MFSRVKLLFAALQLIHVCMNLLRVCHPPAATAMGRIKNAEEGKTRVDAQLEDVRTQAQSRIEKMIKLLQVYLCGLIPSVHFFFGQETYRIIYPSYYLVPFSRRRVC